MRDRGIPGGAGSPAVGGSRPRIGRTRTIRAGCAVRLRSVDGGEQVPCAQRGLLGATLRPERRDELVATTDAALFGNALLGVRASEVLVQVQHFGAPKRRGVGA